LPLGVLIVVAGWYVYLLRRSAGERWIAGRGTVWLRARGGGRWTLLAAAALVVGAFAVAASAANAE
jgi:hypothetical protein